VSRLLIENSSKFVRSFHSVLTVALALALAVVTVLFSLFPELAFASEAPSNLVYQGRVIKPDSNPLEEPSVVFDVSIYSQDGTCLLYEETHSLNMTGTGGMFALTLGAGISTGPGYAIKDVFSNSNSFTGGGSCSYTPSTSHNRIVRVTFDDGGGPVALQDQTIQSVPYALYASKLEGKGKSDFLQINTTTSALSQANANALFQNTTYTELLALASGTSTTFAKAADLPVSSGVLNLSGAGQGVRVLDTPAGGDYAVNKNYSDGKIGGKSIDATNFAGLANGESVKWDTTANSGLGGWVRYTPVSAGGYVVNGGQAGAVSLGSTDANSLTLMSNNTPRVTVDATGNVGIGTSSPGAKLQVTGGNLNIDVDQAIMSGSERLIEHSTSGNIIKIGSGGMTDGWTIGHPDSSQLGNVSVGGGYGNLKFKIALNGADRFLIDKTGKVGIGTISPEATLHLKAGTATANTAPLKFTSGTLLTTPENGTLEYDGTSFYYTTGGARSTFGSGGGPTLSGITSISNASGDITLAPLTSTGAVLVNSGTASVGVNSGALVVTGGVGMSGSLNVGGSYAMSGSGTFDTGTGAVSLNGPTTVAANQNLSMASGSGTFSQIYTGTGTAATITANALTSGKILSLSSNSTSAAAGNTGLDVGISGANGTAGITRYGIQSAITSTGTTSTNVGASFSASGATNNYGLLVPNGRVGVGTTSPGDQLTVQGGNLNIRYAGSSQTASAPLHIEVANGTASMAIFERDGVNHGALGMDASGNFIFGVANNVPSGGFTFRTGTTVFGNPTTTGTEAMRITPTGNVGIGTTAPSTKLNVVTSAAGTPTILSLENSNTGGNGSFLDFVVGGVTQASIGGYDGELSINTNVAGAAIKFRPNDVEKMRIDATGNVGIGTATPSALAHFNATDTTGNSALEALRLSHEDINSAGADGIGASLTFNLETATNNTFREAAKIEGVFDDASNNSKDGSLRFYTMGPNSTSGTTTTTEKMRMNSSGYLGIGTPSPSHRLTVIESVDIEGHMARFSGDGTTTLDGTIVVGGNIAGLHGEQYITFQNGDSGGDAWMAGMDDDETFRITYEAEGEMSSPGFLTILQNGRVGIGTATPNVPFSTNSTGVSAPGGNFSMIASFSDPTDSNGIVLGYDSLGTIGVIGANSDLVNPSQLSLRTYNGSVIVEGLRIDENGKIGVGTPAPSEKLHVVGNLRVQGGTDCTLGNGSGGTNCSSDIRLKENIRQISNPLAKILSLRGVEFDWNEKSQSPGRHDMGVIAQEVEKVFPTAVIEDLETGYKKVDYAVLVAPIIQSLKEINEQLTDLLGLSDIQQKRIESKADRTEVAILRERLAQLELKDKSQNDRIVQLINDNSDLKRRLDRIETQFLSNK
jgi:hypothetical protein